MHRNVSPRQAVLEAALMVPCIPVFPGIKTATSYSMNSTPTAQKAPQKAPKERSGQDPFRLLNSSILILMPSSRERYHRPLRRDSLGFRGTFSLETVSQQVVVRRVLELEATMRVLADRVCTENQGKLSQVNAFDDLNITGRSKFTARSHHASAPLGSEDNPGLHSLTINSIPKSINTLKVWWDPDVQKNDNTNVMSALSNLEYKPTGMAEYSVDRTRERVNGQSNVIQCPRQ
ncbi:hypothetical protein M413DRAFT_6755 [Hebeloma cylindrosporum]|uniref:Uncharacterized protein n=1 Tax=Hebeloma cylindrosporum TaxID=76867 RepID=A0A0C3CMN2_HEBCY|nr:hypothetical protein M413DRAFT_6755 [Hebeloma cylindrosporum h7]